MENLSTYKHYATAIITSVVKKPIIVIPAIGIIELSNIQMALALFFVLLFFDFFTGVLASYTEWKKLGKKTKFFKDGKDGFTSEKWRLSLVKTITYLTLMLLELSKQLNYREKNIPLLLSLQECMCTSNLLV